MVYSTDRSKAMVPVLVLLFVALWFILRGDLFYVLPCDFLFLCFFFLFFFVFFFFFVFLFSVLLALRLPRLWKRELNLVLFVRLFDFYLFGFVGFLFLLVSGKSCGLWLWHFLDFSLTFFFFPIWSSSGFAQLYNFTEASNNGRFFFFFFFFFYIYNSYNKQTLK